MKVSEPKFRDKFEQAEFQACMDHWDKVLHEAEKSDCLLQQIYKLIPVGKRVFKSKSDLLDMIYEKTSVDCICPDEDPQTPYIKNGYSTISMICDIDIDHDLDYEHNNDPDHTWQAESNGRYYKKITCYKVCLPLT